MASTITDRNGGSTSSSPTTTRQTGLATNAAIKAPCHAMATSAITLSGEQTIDGVSCATDKRVLVAGQADSADNGIYIVSTGAWQRSPDFNRNDDVMDGTLIAVSGGTSNGGIWMTVCDTSPAEVGTTEFTFETFADFSGYATIVTLASYALLASPVFTGNPRAPTPTVGDNDTSIATTEFVTAADAILAAATALKANIASPSFTGTVSAAGLVDLSGAAAGQIKFPATMNASSNANTLDDYEEGTWTPAISAQTPGNLSVTYSYRGGFYTKVGRMVSLVFNMHTSAFTHTTASGYATITGMPFAVKNLAAADAVAAVLFSGLTKAGYTQVMVYAGAGTSFMTISASGSGVAVDFVCAIGNFPTGGAVRLDGTLTYFTD